MHIRMFDSACGRGSILAAKTMPENLHADLRTAFRAWLDASKEWSAFHESIAENEDGPTASRRLAELEGRLETAAKAFADAKRRCSESPLYTAMLYAAVFPQVRIHACRGGPGA